MALPMMLGTSLVSGVALYFTSKATKATTNATSSYSPLSGDPQETGSLLCREAFDSSRSVEAAVVDGVVEGNSSVGEGGGMAGRRAVVEPPGLWEAAKRKFRLAKAKLTSRAERMMLDPEENAYSSLLSAYREEILEMESPGNDILSPSPESFESDRSLEAAEVDNPMGTMIVEKAMESNIRSPVATDVIHAVEVDPMTGGNTLATECNIGSTSVADAVHAAEGSKAAEANGGGTSAEVDLMAVGDTLATERNMGSTRAVDVVHAAAVSEASEADDTSADVDPMAVGNTLATECNMMRTGAVDVVNAALVDGDVEGNSCCNVHEVVAEAAKVDDLKVGEEGGATERRGKVEPPGLWEAAKRKFMCAKAKLKSSAEWMMLDPDVVRRILKCSAEWLMLDPAVVRRILKSMFVVVVDSVVNQAFKGNTVAFKLCAILISELKRCM